jgi:hypothetical protein
VEEDLEGEEADEGEADWVFQMGEDDVEEENVEEDREDAEGFAEGAEASELGAGWVA